MNDAVMLNKNVADEISQQKLYARYPEYRDSGVEAIGFVPVGWQVLQLKHTLLKKPGAVKTGPFGSQLHSSEMACGSVKVYNQRTVLDRDFAAGDNYITEEKFKQLAAFVVFPYDVLVTTRGTIGRCAVVPAEAERGILHPCVIRVQPDERYVLREYLSLLIQDSPFVSAQLTILSNATTIEVVYSDSLKQVRLPIPTLSEQQAIASFLDRETGRIDELIVKKQRLIELLAEKRTALISHAVTKGLNPDAPIKDSGIEWLGKIPKHWEVKKLKFLSVGGLGNGLFKKKQFFGSGVRLVNVFDVYRDDFLVAATTLERVEADDAEVRKYNVKPGDVFFVRSSLKLEGVGKSVCMFEVAEPTVFECHIVRMRPNLNAMMPLFLIHYLNSIPATNRLIALANQVTMTTIDQDKFKSLEVPIPPLQEQKAIAEMLSVNTKRFFSLTASVNEAIDKLREYRSALISAAVTGKIDVRGEVKR